MMGVMFLCNWIIYKRLNGFGFISAVLRGDTRLLSNQKLTGQNKIECTLSSQKEV